MDPARATTTGAGGRLLYCSPDRTLVSATNPDTGEVELRKLFERGSLADAEREVAVASWLQHLDVVRCLGAELDPATSRPCVRMQLVEGRDLGQLVAAAGALPAALVCRIGASLAATLAGLHALRRPELPRGLCHGDVKPGNVIWTGERAVLLDFEHTAPIGDGGPGRGWRTGTEGYQAPEAAQLAAPTAAFDVFALGATLRWLLGGGAPDRGLDGQDPELAAVIAACCDHDARGRPQAAALARVLAAKAASLETDAAEHALAALQQGRLDDAAAALAAVPDGPRRARLGEWLGARRRLLQRRPHCLTAPTAPAAEPQLLRRELDQVAALLRRFPRHPGTLARRAALQHRVGELLTQALPQLTQRLREEAFAEAATFLQQLRQLLAAALRLPGQLPIPFDGDARMPSMLQRQPLQFLAGLQHDLEQQQEDHAELVAAIERAEAELDLPTAERAIDRIAERTGGATAAVSRRRDRLHRLGFWLERLARARRSIERLGELTPGEQPALLQFLADCGRCVGIAAGSDNQAAMGLRSLQLTLQSLSEEFPRLGHRLQPCRDELARALEHTTDEAWNLLARAQEKLRAVPVPVRPLQTLLHRLDALRLLEAIVDRPQRPRSQWLDGVEALRFELEQARATRDRLAQGAELAMARGHWTTGLFDMERAVTSLDADDDNTEAARRLHDRLTEARRKKRELETALQRNMELSSRYAALLDAPDADYPERLRVLRERRDGLQFLVMQVPPDRGELYARDLREVETLLMLEQAAEAEALLDHTEMPAERLRLARATLAQLSVSPSATEVGAELPGRIARLQEHWRHLANSAQREVESERAAVAEARRRSRRRRWAGAGASLMLVLLAGLGYQAMAGGRGRPPALQLQRNVAAIADDERAALGELRAFAAAADASLRPQATALIDVVEQGGTDLPDVAAWQASLHDAVLAWAATAAHGDRDPARLAAGQRFGAAAFCTGLVLAALHHRDAATVEALAAAAEAAHLRLASHGIELPADFAAQLRRLQR